MFESEVPLAHILEAIDALQSKYSHDDFSFALENLAGGYQFLTKPAYQASISILLRQQSHKRLSTAQLETLSKLPFSLNTGIILPCAKPLNIDELSYVI